MATLVRKTKKEVFKPRMVGTTYGEYAMEDNVYRPERVYPSFKFGGRVTPRLEITTPAGVVELEPHEVRTLRKLLEAFEEAASSEKEMLVTPIGGVNGGFSCDTRFKKEGT